MGDDTLLIPLTDGPTLPLAVLCLAWTLEDRGLTLLRGPHDQLRVHHPQGLRPDLTADEIARVRTWKLHLLALMAYVDGLIATPSATGAQQGPACCAKPGKTLEHTQAQAA